MLAHNRPSPRLIFSGLAGSKLRFGFAFSLHGVNHDTPSPMAVTQCQTHGGDACARAIHKTYLLEGGDLCTIVAFSTLGAEYHIL
ncbi:MAG: hypothetical protein ACI307_04135 [Sodaliphilus sp.]